MLRRPGPPLALAALATVALAVTGALAKLIPLTQRGDGRTLDGFLALNRPRLTPLLDAVAHSADPRPYAIVALVLAVVALVRGRPRVAVAIPIVFVATGATTETLKHVLASPRFDEWFGPFWQISDASWPSGHSTAAMTMALCAVLAAPPRLRPTVAALGGAYAVAVAYAILTLGWHFPSDVFGGYLVATTYVLLAIAAVNASERLRPSRRGVEAATRPADLAGAAVVALIGVGAAAGVALARPRQVLDYAATHTTFVAGALAIAALAALIAGVMAFGFRPAPTAAPRRRWPPATG